METTVNQRIAEIIGKLGYKSKRSFAEKIGIAQTSFNDILRGAEPKYTTLRKILLAEPLISSEWLLTGNGDMMKSSEPSETVSEQNKEERLLSIIESQQRLIESQQKLIESLQNEKRKAVALEDDRADFADASGSDVG